jgi:hypothetical protein
MECEHCAHTQKLDTGYDDAFYHQRVIPTMTCESCGKNRAGVAGARNTDGHIHVPQESLEAAR